MTGEIAEGSLACSSCHTTIPILQNIPRFVPSESYASSFGFQWNRFDRLQVDKFMNNDLSRDRFYKTTGWSDRLEGQRILEAGCGAGRFTDLALKAGACTRRVRNARKRRVGTRETGDAVLLG